MSGPRFTRAAHPENRYLMPLIYAVVIGSFVSAYVLYYSLHYGVLVGLLQWDDCAIILRGIANLDLIARATTFGGMALNLLHLDIHAPLSDIQVMAGLLFSGGTDLGPFVLSPLWLILCLAAIYYTLDQRSAAVAIAITVFFCTQPLTINALTIMKSDWRGGLLLSVAIVLLESAYRKGDTRLKYFGATFVSLAILSKITEFYLPFDAVILIVIFELYGIACSGQNGIRRKMDAVLTAATSRHFWLTLAIAIVPFILFFLWKIRGITQYIGLATSGVWLDNMSLFQRVIFYSPGNSNSPFVWGNLYITFALFCAVAFVVAIVNRKYYYIATLIASAAIFFAFLAPLLLAKVSALSFSASALGVVMGVTILSMKFLDAASPRWGGYIVLFCVLLITAFTKIPLENSDYFSEFSISDDSLRSLSQTYARLVSVMTKDAAYKDPEIVVCFDQIFAPFPNIAIKYFLITGRIPNVGRIDDLSALSEREMSSADYVLTIVPTTNGNGGSALNLFPKYPISRNPKAADDLMKASPSFAQDGSFQVPGGEIHLYKSARD